MNTKNIILAIFAIAIIAGSIVAYTYYNSNSANSNISIQASLTGAGASFPYPLIDKMIEVYTKAKPHIQINYQPSGSGAGITSLTDKIVDFAGSDAPLSATEREKAPNILHIPETTGSIAIAYNIPGFYSGLKLTGQVIADIFEGKIAMWDDPAIVSLNPDIILPSAKITTVHRSESSGTTFVFTSYLSEISTSWKDTVGQSKSVSWPAANDVASNGNTGVAQIITSTSHSIGYVEFTYALQTGMTVAAIRNPSGNYVLPTLETTTIAAQSVASSLPTGDADWAKVNILNTKATNAYPIVSFSYILIYKELNTISGMTQTRAEAIVQFLWYMIHDGQKLASNLEYAPLPDNVITINEATIRSITFNGQTLPTE
jgi:phosphate ABC transporter phosphate-binding protein